MEMLEVVAKNIKKAREASNLSQTELGRIVGLTQTQISKIEKGKSGTTITNVVIIAKALNISVFELMGAKEISPNNSAMRERLEDTTFDISSFAAIVGYAAELADKATHNERVRAAQMLKRALALLEDSETERLSKRQSDGAA